MWWTEPVPSGSRGPPSPRRVILRVLLRHIRWQDAGSVDLTNSEQELDQE
jgi:hypothetical protein